MVDFSFLSIDNSPEAQALAAKRKAEEDAFATLNADYQWIVCCQQMPRAELEQVIEEGKSPVFEGDEHYQKRYLMASVVHHARFGAQEDGLEYSGFGRPSQGRSKRVQISITEKMYESIEEMRKKGESFSDVAYRLLNVLAGKKGNRMSNNDDLHFRNGFIAGAKSVEETGYFSSAHAKKYVAEMSIGNDRLNAHEGFVMGMVLYDQPYDLEQPYEQEDFEAANPSLHVTGWANKVVVDSDEREHVVRVLAIEDKATDILVHQEMGTGKVWLYHFASRGDGNPQ